VWLLARGPACRGWGSFGASSFDDLGGLAVARSGEDKLHVGFGQIVNFVTTGDDEREVGQPGKMPSYKIAAVSQIPTHTYYFDAGHFTLRHCGIHSSSGTSPARLGAIGRQFRLFPPYYRAEFCYGVDRKGEDVQAIDSHPPFEEITKSSSKERL
jgi:hypothetical protein